MPVRFTPTTTTKSAPSAVRFTPAGTNKKTSVWEKIGAGVSQKDIEQSFIEGRPFQATALAVKQAGQQLATVPWAFANQFLLDYPRQFLEKKYGLTVPMAENKLVKGASYVAGALGGLKNPLLRTMGGAEAFLAAPLTKKALISGAQAMAYPTADVVPNFIEHPVAGTMEKLGQGLGGAAMGAALPLAGKGLQAIGGGIKKIPGAPEFFAKAISGVTDFTKNTIHRLGTKVFTPEYSAEDYVGRVLTPKIQEHVLGQIDNPGNLTRPTLSLIKARESDVTKLLETSRAGRKLFTQGIREGLANDNPYAAQDAAEALVAKAGQEMDAVIAAHNKPIPLTSTINSIPRILKEMGWATSDKKGNLIPRQLTNVPHTTRDTLIELYNYWKKPPMTSSVTVPVVQYGQKIKAARVLANAQDFQKVRFDLERLFTGEPQNDKVVAYVLNSLVEEAKGARGIAGYKEASKKYADAMLFKKLAPRINTLVDPRKINTQFTGINAGTAGKKYQELKAMQNALPAGIYDDLAAHYAAMNFNPEFYPSLSGVRKMGITEISKAFYKKYPQGIQTPELIQKATAALKGAAGAVQEAARPVTAPLGEAGRMLRYKALEEPYLSPGTKEAAARMATSRRGAIDFGGLKKKALTR